MQAARLGLGGGAGQAVEDRAQVEAPVEEVLHLTEIVMRVLAESERTATAGRRSLDVAQGRVDGQERRMLDAGRAATCDVRLVNDAHPLHRLEATQAVGDRGGRRGARLLGEVLDGLLGERALRQAHQHGLA